VFHFGVGVAGEAVLLAAGEGIAEPDEPVCRAGDGQQVVEDGAGDGVEFDEEAFFAAFDVERGGAVGEAEAGGLVDDVEDAADVDGPEAQSRKTWGVGFDGYELIGVDSGVGIGDADPAEVELLPALEGGFGGFEVGFAVADLAAGVVAGVAGVLDAGLVFGQGGDAVGERQVSGCLQSVADEEFRRFVEREHASVCHGEFGTLPGTMMVVRWKCKSRRVWVRAFPHLKIEMWGTQPL
jgi:hypothetical protein